MVPAERKRGEREREGEKENGRVHKIFFSWSLERDIDIKICRFKYLFIMRQTLSASSPTGVDLKTINIMFPFQMHQVILTMMCNIRNCHLTESAITVSHSLLCVNKEKYKNYYTNFIYISASSPWKGVNLRHRSLDPFLVDAFVQVCRIVRGGRIE